MRNILGKQSVLHGFQSHLMPPRILLLLRLLVAVFFTNASFTTASSDFPIAKPGCDDQCGNVRIPFPFGTREGCYRDKTFFVNCSLSPNNLHPPKPFWPLSRRNVTDISLEGQLRILQSVGYDCYDDPTVRPKYFWPSTLLQMPFVFNTTVNKLTAIGCDTSATVEGVVPPRIGTSSSLYRTGCSSVCSSSYVVDSCSGIGCCQTAIPLAAYEIIITMTSFYNHSLEGAGPCTYAFVVEDKAFNFSADNFTNFDTNSSFPVVVDWVIANETCEEAQKNKTTFACTGDHSICYQPEGGLGYRCRCKEGYTGSPYLPDPHGCVDIDECGDPSLNNCAANSICKNMPGNYTCQCRKNYHGDGRKDGQQCTANQNNWPIIAGVGVSAATLILLGFATCLYFEMMRRNESKKRDEFFRKNGGLILQQKLIGQGFETRNPRVFTHEELLQATNGFDESQIIGRGGFGTVFKGELKDNQKVVAIKKSKGVDQTQVEQFVNEVILLSKISNRHVVELLGCCLETEVPLLVYEFIDNGTLLEHLQNKISNVSKLHWNIRLRIASEVAGVLSYLHSIASPPIIHRDIKSSNILLDHRYTAKLSDFGISRLVPMDEHQVSTVVQGTHGYLDPEYMQTGLLTEKSDVYSFGVVLIELLTGKKVLAVDRPEAERFLSYHFLSCLKKDQLVHILDSNINWSVESFEQVKEVAKIAKKCISVNGEDRPSMKDVARELEVLGLKAQKLEVDQIFHIESPESMRSDRDGSNMYRVFSTGDHSSGDQYSIYTATE